MEAKLARIETELQSIRKEHQEKQAELLQAHLDEREPLLQRRYELVSGRSAATDDELQGFTGPRTTGPIKPQGIPCFWLNALCAEPDVSQSITASDKAALAYLQDIRFLRGTAGWKGMMLEFHFAENPFFENRVLRRGLSLTEGPQGQVVDIQEEATVVDWKDGMSLLVKRVKVNSKKNKKKANKRKGKGGAGRSAAEDEGEGDEGVTRVKPVPSFFRFFTPLQKKKTVDPTAVDEEDDQEHHPVFEEDEDMTQASLGGMSDDDDPEATVQKLNAEMAAMDSARRKAERDLALLDAVVKRVIPRAVHLYLAAPQGTNPEDEDESDYTVVNSAAATAHGGGAALPAAAQQVLYALQQLQSDLDKSCRKLKEAKWKLAQELDVREQSLLDDRAGLLRPKEGSAGTRLPLFWLRALRASEAGSPAVARRDEVALSHLVDVRARLDWGHMPTPEEPWRKVRVEWVFSENPYFPAVTLCKEYTLVCENGSFHKLSLDQAGKVVTRPAWTVASPPHTATEEGVDDLTPGGCDLSLDPPAATAKPGAKPVPAASFFNLFKPGCLRHAFAGLDDTEGNLDEAALLAEAQLVTSLMSGELRYHPMVLYNQVEVDEEDLGHEYNEFEEEDEEEEEEEDEGSYLGSEDAEAEEEEEEDVQGQDEDADQAASKVRRRRPRSSSKAAAGSGWSLWPPSKSTVFLILTLLMVFGQIWMYVEMFSQKQGPYY